MKENDHYKTPPEISGEELRNLWNLVQLAIRRKYGDVIGGTDIETLFLDAVADAYSGKRRYPGADTRGNEVGVYTFIRNIVKSKISHIRKREKKYPRLSINEILEKPNTKTHTLFLKNIAILPDYDEQIYYAEFISGLKKKAQSDPLVLAIIDLKIQNPDIRPKEIAENTGRSEKTARKASDRLRLMAWALIKEFERRNKVG